MEGTDTGYRHAGRPFEFFKGSSEPHSFNFVQNALATKFRLELPQYRKRDGLDFSNWIQRAYYFPFHQTEWSTWFFLVLHENIFIDQFIVDTDIAIEMLYPLNM